MRRLTRLLRTADVRFMDEIARVARVPLTQREQAAALCLLAPDRWGDLGDDGAGGVDLERGGAMNPAAQAKELSADLTTLQQRTVSRAVQRLRPIREAVDATATEVDIVRRVSRTCELRPAAPGSRFREVVWDPDAALDVQLELAETRNRGETYDANVLRDAARPLIREIEGRGGAPSHRPGAVEWAGGVENIATLAEASGVSEPRLREILRPRGGPRRVPRAEASAILGALGLGLDDRAVGDRAVGHITVGVADGGSALAFQWRLT